MSAATLFQNQNNTSVIMHLCRIYAILRSPCCSGRCNLNSTRLVSEVVNSLPHALVVIDSCDNVVLWNKAAESLFGWRSSEVMGRPVPIVPADRADEFRAFTEIVRSGKPLQVLTRRVRKDGAPVEVRANVVPLQNRSGRVHYVLAAHEPLGETLLAGMTDAQRSTDNVRRHGKKGGATRSTRGILSRFTPRQRQIIRLVAGGHGNEAIARRLSLNEQVIKNYLSGIYRELRIHSRAELIVCLNRGAT
jgi:PAS domain S-box-containing protein